MIKPKLASSSDSCFSLTAIPLETPAADVGVDSNQVLMYPLLLIVISTLPLFSGDVLLEKYSWNFKRQVGLLNNRLVGN